MKDKNLRVQLAIDNLPQFWPASLKGCRLGAVLHPASVNSKLQHTAEVLHSLDGHLFKLTCLFGPQHGIMGETQANMIEWEGGKHKRFGIPVYSLYGEHREPTSPMLKNLDALLIDLQDVGARYYTYIWTLFLCMKACEKSGKTVVVIDRPNPINGRTTEGPVLDLHYASFVGLHAIPVRHAKTIGEMAVIFKKERFPGCELFVLPMENWTPDMWFDETGLPWVMPSPNIPALSSAVVYPGMCLFEATNISEGRGTTRPFELFGAPFIDGHMISAELNKKRLPGIVFREAHFLPTFDKFKGVVCHGCQMHIVNRDSFLPFQTAVEILKTIRTLYPKKFEWLSPPYEYEYEILPIDILLGCAWQSVFSP